MSAPTQGTASGGGRTPRAGLPVGRFFGVPLYLSPSWLIIALIVTVTYSGLIDDAVVGIGPPGTYVVAFAFAVLLAVSLLLHELGHTAVSLALGMPVRRVVIFLLGGVSEIEKEPSEPGQEYLVAVAGPLVSLVLAAGSAALLPLADRGTVARTMILLLVWSNLAVAVFNLLPGLPLDGGRLVRAGVWRLSGDRLAGTRAAAWGGRGVAVLVLLGAVAMVRPDGAVGIGNVLLASLLAAFIWVGATQSLTSATMSARMPEIQIASLVRPTLTVPPDLPVAEALRRAWTSGVRALVVVDATGAPRALVSESHVIAVPEARRPWTTVADVARPLEPGLVLADSLSGAEVVEAFRRTPASEYLVVGHDGGTVGVLSAADVARILQGHGMPLGASA
ncbi:MAG TPA: site-2 protease family protein [Mycobacteriales bacterium]|nr:site-2 protease family protein [Mycobacteriales bacterium]